MDLYWGEGIRCYAGCPCLLGACRELPAEMAEALGWQAGGGAGLEGAAKLNSRAQLVMSHREKTTLCSFFLWSEFAVHAGVVQVAPMTKSL
jgi:hypothetical protein